jgi:hypothetical protein
VRKGSRASRYHWGAVSIFACVVRSLLCYLIRQTTVQVAAYDYSTLHRLHHYHSFVDGHIRRLRGQGATRGEIKAWRAVLRKIARLIHAFVAALFWTILERPPDIIIRQLSFFITNGTHPPDVRLPLNSLGR